MPADVPPASTPEPPEGELTHLDAEGTARMVDVGAKEVTDREAVAGCTVRLHPETAARLLAGDLPKGDAVTVARIAGIQAAKRTSELIPLCHQVRLTSVDVDLDVDAGSGEVSVTCRARAADRTGVEMEALVGATTAALTIYDMVKAIQRDVVVTDARLLHKHGGRHGTWTAPDAP